MLYTASCAFLLGTASRAFCGELSVRRSKLRLFRERIWTYVTDSGDAASSAPINESKMQIRLYRQPDQAIRLARVRHSFSAIRVRGRSPGHPFRIFSHFFLSLASRTRGMNPREI